MQYLTKPVVLDSVELRNIALPQRNSDKDRGAFKRRSECHDLLKQAKERAKREAEQKRLSGKRGGSKEEIGGQGHAG